MQSPIRRDLGAIGNSSSPKPSQEEIAAILGCTRKAVETRIYRARQILRERLAEYLSEG